MNQFSNKRRFILIDVVPPTTPKEEAIKNLDELISLVDTYGGATVVRVIQRRANPDQGTYVGSGKAIELVQIVKDEKIDGVVLNAIVKPGQIFRLEQILWEANPTIQVWDRVGLILQIFGKHAHSTEAKLQIELARLGHMGPRMYGLGGTVLSRQGAGIGTRGKGETNIELMKRHWRDAMKEITDKLKKISKERERQLERRREKGFKTISIVGYTNAGKTTMFNRLTGKKKIAEDVLFATLDSSVGEIYFPDSRKQILISDTIGFIQNLPPALIDAFKSTLMESVFAQTLLHVIDASDPKMHEKIQIVEDILYDLGIDDKDRVYVFNKVDNLNMIHKDEIIDRYKEFNPHFVSAKTGEGISELLKTIEKKFTQT